MDVSAAGSKQYDTLVSKRKKMWEKLFRSFKNVGENSDEIAISDLPMICKPTGITSNSNNSNDGSADAEEYPADDLDTISDPNNEDFDDISEAESEDTAKFSDSDDENFPTLPRQVKHIIAKYESDSDDELSDDLDDSNSTGEDERDFIDKYFDQMRNSRLHYLGDVEVTDDASDHSDEEDSFDNENIKYLNDRRNSRIQLENNEDVDDANKCSEDENQNTCETQRKRKFSETEMVDDDIIEIPPNKKINCQLKNVNIYINANESDFENDSD